MLIFRSKLNELGQCAGSLSLANLQGRSDGAKGADGCSLGFPTYKTDQYVWYSLTPQMLRLVPPDASLHGACPMMIYVIHVMQFKLTTSAPPVQDEMMMG